MNQTLFVILVILGVAAGIAVPAYLAIRLLKWLNTYLHKKWLRVEVKGYEQLSFPDECPNCLNAPSYTFVRIIRVVHGHPFSITYSFYWPHCRTCADFISGREKLQTKYSHYWLVVFAITVLGGLFYFARYFSHLGLIYAAIILVSASIFLYLQYRKLDNKRPLKDGYTTRGHTVLLNYVGKDIFTGKYSLDVFLRNPQYARLFIERNAALKPRYDPDRLKTLLNQLELSQVSHNL